MSPLNWRPTTTRLEEEIAAEQAKLDAALEKRKWQPEAPTFAKQTIAPSFSEQKVAPDWMSPLSSQQEPEPLTEEEKRVSGYQPPQLPGTLTQRQRQPSAIATAPPPLPRPQPAIAPKEVAWWEQPADITEKVMAGVGQGISKVPILPKVLQFAAPAFEWLHTNLEKPWASTITAPFSPDIPWKPGESWLEHEEREYDAWKAPTYVKGLAEFSMPLWWMPWFGWVKATAKPLIGAGKAAKMAAVLPKQPFEALLPTYTQLEAFIPDNLVKRTVLKLENAPVLNKMVKAVGGEAAFTRRNPITAANKARNYAVFWGQHRDIGENIVRTKMNDLTVKRIVDDAGKQVYKSENDFFKFVDQEMFKGQRVNANIASVTTDATHPGVIVGGKRIPAQEGKKVVPDDISDISGFMFSGSASGGAQSNWFSGSVDKALDFAKARLKSGRGGEAVVRVYRIGDIESRGANKIIDLMESFGKQIPSSEYSMMYLKDIKPTYELKLTKGFKTTKEDILNQLAIPKAEAGIGGKVSYAMDDVWQNPNLYKWSDKAAEAYVKEGHEIVGWMMNWAKANGVQLPSQKRGLKIVGEIIQQHIPRTAKGVIKEEGMAAFKRTDPFREMIYETAREGIEAGVKYGGTFADRVDLMSRAIARKVAQNKFDNAVKPMGKTLLERLEALEPEIVGKFTTQANRVDALQKGLVSLEKNKPVYYATMALIKEEFPDLARAMEGITAITPQVASDYVRAMAKSSTLILEKNREPLVSELLSSPKNSFYDVFAIAKKYTKSESNAVRLSSAWYRQQLKARATEYKNLLANVKNNLLPAEKTALAISRAEVAKLKRSLRVPKAEKLEARFNNHPAFNNRIFPTEVADVLAPLLADRGQNWIRQLAQVSGLSRMVTATLDISAPFIQGTALFGRNPVAWAKATGQMLGIVARPQNLYLELAKRRGSIMERVLAGGGATAIDFFEAMPTLRGLTRRVPLGERAVAETFGRAEAAWLGFGELARDELWMAGKAAITAKGLPEAAMAGQLRELAHSLDLMTGIMSPQAIGIPMTQQQVESAFMFFAPRYTRAGLSFAGNVLQGGLSGAEARKALAGFMLGGLTMYKAATEVLGQEMNLNPNSGRFMTLKIGDTYVGVGGIYYALMRLSADIVSTASEDPASMLPTNLSRVDNPFYKFLYNRTSPLTGLTFGLAIEHKDFLGEPFEDVGDYAKFMAERVLPFSVESQMPWTREPWQDSAFQPAELGAQLAGLRAFPESSWEARNNYRDNLAQDRYQRNWGQLNKVERKDIELDYPILDKFDDYVSQQQARRGEVSDKLRSSWQQQIDDAQANRDELINRAAVMAGQDRDYWTFRLRVKDIENDYGAVIASINSTKVYQPIMEAIRTPKTLEQLSAMDKNEMAYNIWAQFRYSSQETPFGLMQNEIGEPNWDNIEKLRNWVRQQFGEDSLAYIEQERPLAGRELPPLFLELQKAEQAMKPYYAVRDTVARLFGQRFADSTAGERLIASRRKQMRMKNPQLERAFQMFFSTT